MTAACQQERITHNVHSRNGCEKNKSLKKQKKVQVQTGNVVQLYKQCNCLYMRYQPFKAAVQVLSVLWRGWDVQSGQHPLLGHLPRAHHRPSFPDEFQSIGILHNYH